MSDLSQPPSGGCLHSGRFSWPTPDLAGYARARSTRRRRLPVEGLNGRTLEGRLTAFDPAQGLLQLRMNSQRKAAAAAPGPVSPAGTGGCAAPGA
jgi:hypothetical protein